MILVDTNIWISHFRKSSSKLEDALRQSTVLVHPLVIGELACGRLRNRAEILFLLRHLPQAESIEDEEMLDFIESEGLHSRGIGIVDAHLLASARYEGAEIWTSDKALAREAKRLSLLS